MTPEFIEQMIYALLGAGSVYAAIRADLARLHERTASLQRQIDKLEQAQK